MVVYANILFPLYIYPLKGAWNPLITAAKQYTNTTFTAVINPYDGPWPQANGCPNSDYIDAIYSLNKLPNVNTMGYVHTANRYDCGPNGPGSGTDICPCSAPIADVKKNITAYANWAKLSCNSSHPDVHIDSLFIDESPNEDGGACLSYMKNLTSFARSSGLGLNASNGDAILFNAGYKTDLSYFSVADVIVILEGTEEQYDDIADIDTYNGNGQYYSKSSVILYNHSTDTTDVRQDVQTILGKQNDAFASLFITNRATDQYSYFPSNWLAFVKEVEGVAVANKKIQ